MPASGPTLESLFSVKDRVALVTGAAKGIGRAVGVLLAGAGGARVAFNDLPGVAGHHALAEEIRAKGGAAIAVDGDVAKEADVARMTAVVEDGLGPVDILVNNAGITLPRTIDETGLADWDTVLAVHLGGAFLLSRAVLPSMIARRRGVIIQMASVVGHRGALAGHIAYGTVKAGLLGFTKTLARTAGPHGVRVNAVAPGIVETDMLLATHSREEIEGFAAMVPLGTVASPEDVAAAVLFLASPAAAYVHGAVLDVNGGSYMR